MSWTTSGVWKKADKLVSEYRYARKKLTEEKAELAKHRKAVQTAVSAQDFFQEVAKEIQQQTHAQISSVVTRCLEAMEYDYEFRIVFDKKRGKTEARLVFVRDDAEVDPTTESGGGALEVASFALRLACLLLVRPSARKLLVLDEPFGALDDDRQDRVRDLLAVLSEETGVQFLMVTHEEGLKIGKIIRIGEKT
jgi:DNA repair exonuclease SbcCD ATPase subunit